MGHAMCAQGQNMVKWTSVVVCPSTVIEFSYIVKEVGSILNKMSFQDHEALQWVWTKHDTKFVPYRYYHDTYETNPKLDGGF